MSPSQHPIPSETSRRRPGAGPLAALGAALVAALVAACGGGGSDTPAASASLQPSAYTAGAISGFGSIIVNGVRFDDSSASVTDDAGVSGDTQKQALRLGMQVEVDSATVGGTARALAVRFGSRVLGPVAGTPGPDSFTVLGQTVDVTASTVFDDSLAAGLSAINAGDVIEVHGVVSDTSTGRITASRIDKPDATPTRYKLRGTVAGLDATAKTFHIGGALISYAGLASTLVPSTLANGANLRVLLDITPSNGAWVALSLGVKPVTPPADHLAAQVRGSITAFTSATAFTVNGLVVDASAASFPDGTAGIVLGAEVEVQGSVSNGVLVATRVELESRHQGDDKHRLQLFGAITAATPGAKTFVVRNVTVSYGDATTYVNGSVADLLVGRKVQVQGAVGSTRKLVQASQVTFE